MNLDIILVTVIISAVIVVFITGWIRMEIVPLLIPVTLVVSGLVTAEEVFSGFSNSAVITVAALFVITTGLVRSGVVNRAAESLNLFTGSSKRRLMFAVTALPGLIAGFIKVVSTVLFFIPTVIRMSLQSKVSRSRLLLPMVATCLLGGNITLIGASHNLVVNGLLESSQGYGFTFFEFLPIGIAVLIIAVIYNLFLGWRLLPEGDPVKETIHSDESDLIKLYGLTDRLWELWVQEQSPAIGKNIRQLGLGESFGLCVLSVIRSEEQLPAEHKDLEIQAGDVLLVLGKEDKIKELAEIEGLFLAGHPRKQNKFSISTAEMVELVVPPRSPVIGKTLTDIHFRENFGLSGIALWRNKQPHRTNVGVIPLEEGDGLLLYGDRKKTRNFKPGRSFRWLHPPRKEEAPPELKRYGPLAVVILLMVIVFSALGWLPVSVAAVTGAAVMVLTRILKPREIYSSIDWKVIILIGCLYPLGLALNNSGASSLIAEKLLLLGGYNPVAVLAIIAAASILFTQPLHNVAAAVIMTPVALDAANILGSNPKSFVVAVIIGVSAAFMMPIGHPVSLLVQLPGNYQAKDYVKYGAGLCILVLLAIVVIIPIIWPFYI